MVGLNHMCELLIQMVPRNGSTVYQTAKLPQSGDVIAIMEDGHPWGTIEKNYTDWRIFALPGVDGAVFANLITAEVPATITLANVAQYRGYYLALAAITGAPIVAAIANRATPIVSLSSTTYKPAFLAAVTKRAALTDPAVIG